MVSGKLWLIFVRLLPYGKVVRAGTELRSILKVEAMGVNADLYEEGRLANSLTGSKIKGKYAVFNWSKNEVYRQRNKKLVSGRWEGEIPTESMRVWN